MSLIKSCAVAVTAAAMTFAAASNAFAVDFVKMSTLGPGSSPNLVMTTFANIVNDALDDVEIQVNATGAATVHAVEAARGEVDLYMSAPSVIPLMERGVAMYQNVEGAPELAKKLRTIFNFPLGAYHLTVYDDSGIASLEDLRGKKVFLGPPGGGATRIAAQLIEFTTGMKAGEDFEQISLDWNAAAAGFMDRRFDVYINPTVAPSPVIQQIALTSKIRFLGVSDEQLASEAMKPLLNRPGGTVATIPVGLYGGNQVNDADVTTVASIVGIGVRADLSDDLVYAMTKAFWEGRDRLVNDAPFLRDVTLDGAFAELNQTLHPGAVRYYREIGLDVPAEFVASQ